MKEAFIQIHSQLYTKEVLEFLDFIESENRLTSARGLAEQGIKLQKENTIIHP
ncbi:hypothetical protein EXN66_Car011968 [Channa argus]|uniref:Uncharacterized protein n=1 Tax=Channa argus TaxID=215402 RepID=A0A6G1Q110_CHAAH|nr:hypothetical protein EXN66_Car011968 [Channa argus]